MIQGTSSVEFHSRKAAASDLPRLVEMINAAYSVESFLEGTRTDIEHLPASLETGEILKLEDGDGKLLASVYLELRGDRGYMGMLAVDPASQGQGLSRVLFAASEEYFRARGCAGIDIHVLNLRPELLPLYRRLGFVETGIEEFTYPRTFREGTGPCHCIVMTKTL